MINLRFLGAPVETCQEKSPEKKDDAIVPWGDVVMKFWGNSLVNVVIQCDLTDRDWDLNLYCRDGGCETNQNLGTYFGVYWDKQPNIHGLGTLLRVVESYS